MRKLVGGVMVLLVLAVAATAALAFEGGGRQPSEAPAIAYGQRYSANLNNHQADANYGGYREVALWKLPPLNSRDTITVNWHVLPYTAAGRTGEFPVCMTLAQGITDFSWGAAFEEALDRDYCDDDAPLYSVSGSGTAQTTITVQETNSTSSYLEFFSRASETNTSKFETYPYDFSVEAPRHYLGVAFAPVTKIQTNSTLRASVTGADGSPGPDGLTFTLTATWSGGGIATYTAASVGGGLSYGLALPATAAGKTVSFQLSRAADADYQAAESKLSLSVEKPAPTVDAKACRAAKQRVLVLSRQYNRLRRHTVSSRGRARKRLRHKSRKVNRKLQAARSRAKTTCTPS